MATTYTVVKGDWLDKIARNHGFDSWRDLYYHPDNARFRARRPDPNLIYPGDQIVIPNVVTAVTANGATLIPPDGNRNIQHFVTPKAAGRVTLTATISPNTPSMRGRIVWEGATPDPGNPLQASVAKSVPAKHVVRIKFNGRVQKELRVWVIWSTITTTDRPIRTRDPVTVIGTDQGVEIKGGFNFRHQILPATVITDRDRPNLRGLKKNDPPGGNHPIFGDPLSGGANNKWDNSRQVRAKIVNPDGLDLTKDVYQPPPRTRLTYPVNGVEGNDDRTTGDETNDPYANGGVLTGTDAPSDAVAHRAGSNGDTYEYRLHFREFTRVELDGTWHRISDYLLWRIHLKFRKTGGKWVNDGSDKALDNSGF